jgi:hypothetical protein
LIHVVITRALCQTVQSPVPPAGQIADVTCEGDPAQSYALYLPSTYSAANPWPIIYFFDPGGQGRRPLELYKALAEKYGFVMAGSNNSRNFSSDQSHILTRIAGSRSMLISRTSVDSQVVPGSRVEWR